MKTKKQKIEKEIKSAGDTFMKRLGEDSWTYIKTVVDIVREPILILDEDLRVISANEPFYNTFQVTPEDTENEAIYELGNGQWDIPALRKLLENILPKDTFFRGFEVNHKFPVVGQKMMMLNARQIHCKKDDVLGACPPIILLAIEDITEMMNVAQKLSDHTTSFETRVTEKTQTLERHIVELEKQIVKFRKISV